MDTPLSDNFRRFLSYKNQPTLKLRYLSLMWTDSLKPFLCFNVGSLLEEQTLILHVNIICYGIAVIIAWPLPDLT